MRQDSPGHRVFSPLGIEEVGDYNDGACGGVI